MTHNGTAMQGASALDLRMYRMEVRPMSLTLAKARKPRLDAGGPRRPWKSLEDIITIRRVAR